MTDVEGIISCESPRGRKMKCGHTALSVRSFVMPPGSAGEKEAKTDGGGVNIRKWDRSDGAIIAADFSCPGRKNVM